MEAPSLPGFNLDRTFFGLEPKDRLAIHEMIFDLIWWGAGRWDWNTVYNMPIFLRTFWIQKLNDKLTPPEPKPAKKSEKTDKITRPPQFASKPKT
jgi:hypothetical protein